MEQVDRIIEYCLYVETNFQISPNINSLSPAKPIKFTLILEILDASKALERTKFSLLF